MVAAAAIAVGPWPCRAATGLRTRPRAGAPTWAPPPHPPPSCVRSPRRPDGCGGYLISQILVAACGLKLKHLLSDLHRIREYYRRHRLLMRTKPPSEKVLLLGRVDSCELVMSSCIGPQVS
jgi:hypothetical protein